MLIVVVPWDGWWLGETHMGRWWEGWSLFWDARVVGSFVFSRLEPVGVLMTAQGSARVEGFLAKIAFVLPYPGIGGSCCGLERTFSVAW